jgi:trimethylamine--corrinoid protein Co-methyltransferase
MRPTVRFLDDALIGRIVDEARGLLEKLGVEVQDPGLLDVLGEHGARVERGTSRAFLPGALLDRALATAPRAFRLFDVLGDPTHDFTGSKVHFTPGSSALNVLDWPAQTVRRPVTADYAACAKVVQGLPHIAAQSTAFVPADVPDAIADAYRLYLSLMLGEKPVVTGAFTAEGFPLMHELLAIARGGTGDLRAKPLAVFSACPTSPFKWSRDTARNVVDCARAGVPVEFIAMPMAGFLSPVTLTGTVVQHTAETLSGIVLHQCAAPGAPFLYGGSPGVFDIRYETTPMGAIETMMIDAAYNEVGKSFGFPTQAYTALSDAKRLDAQAGLETGMGAALAVLAGINSVSGPGMMDFENCVSLEKLVVDHEICGMALRLGRGIEPREDFPALPRFEELLREEHLLISPHTRKYLKSEIAFPGPVIDRASRARWAEEGSGTLGDRAHAEVERLIGQWTPSRLADDLKGALTERMAAAAKAAGADALPPLP